MTAISDEVVRVEPKASMNYFDLLQVLLARVAFARDKVDFTRVEMYPIKRYIMRLDTLVGHLLPEWRGELAKSVEHGIDEIKEKFMEGYRTWASGDPDGAREVWKDVLSMADNLRDRILTLLQEKGVLYFSRRVSVYDSSEELIEE